MALDEPTNDTATLRDPSVAAATARLFVEFTGSVQLTTISSVVVRSRNDLSGIPDTALPELVERLARQRLLHATGAEGAG